MSKTFLEAWGVLVSKAPTLEDSNSEITYKSETLKTLLEQFFDKGVENQKAQENQTNPNPINWMRP